MSFRRQALYGALSLLIPVTLFFLVEGIASFTLVAHKAFEPHSPLAEQRHTRYDAQLGWSNLPNVYIPDMYGPGIYLRTNSLGFRSDSEFSREVPAGKIRAICSGDSFTLGYGVANNRTWCQDLAAIDPRLETVNMGQGGYGLDQAYLWYVRDGAALDHDLHIFSFIGTDIRRMGSDMFEGYPKPTLSVRDGRLVAHNVPVPRLHSWSSLAQRFLAFRDLQSVALLQKTLFPHAVQAASPDSPAILQTAAKIFEDVAARDREKNSVLIVAFLPTEGEYRAGMPRYIARLKADLIARGLIWIDLVDDFRKLSPEEARRMFIAADAMPNYRTAAGHYTSEGNAYVAQLLYQKITAIAAVRAELARPGHRAASGPM